VGIAKTNPSVTLDVSGSMTVSNAITIGSNSVQRMYLDTARTTTSGTSIDITGIPSWAKKVTIMFNAVSTNGSSLVQVQIGTSGGVQATGYNSVALVASTALQVGNSTTGFVVGGNTSNTNLRTGIMTLSLLNPTTNLWIASLSGSLEDLAWIITGGGSKTLSGVLDRVRLTTVNGTDTFDNGSMNILVEGF
jgi:hypothetical protein